MSLCNVPDLLMGLSCKRFSVCSEAPSHANLQKRHNKNGAFASSALVN
jgi:hypothetical protein